jgi:hypothetical protein
MIRCRSCQCPIEPNRAEPGSAAIQVKPTLVLVSPQHEDEDFERDDAHRHPTPRAPFPWTALLVVLIGLLFFLLAFSIGFNVWFISQPENRLRMEDARRAEQVAMQQRIEAEKAVEVALLAEQRARENRAAVRQEAERLPWGTLEGRVVWKGELPKVVDLEPRMREHADREHLLKGPKEQMLEPTWRIDPKTRGVANVAVFIKRPQKGLLPIHPDDRVRKENVVIDTPFGAFEPHMVVVYSGWNDGKDRGQTGQKFIIRNSSPLPHNARASGHPMHNDGFNKIVLSNTETQFNLNVQPLPLFIVCDVHSWMSAYAWAFDHPSRSRASPPTWRCR